MKIRAPFSYYGGKGRLAYKIVPLLPHPVKRYCEPFGGAMNVLLKRPPPPKTRLDEIWNDLNGGLANFFRVLRDDYDSLIHKASFTIRSRNDLMEAEIVHREGCEDDVLWAWATMTTFLYSYGGTGDGFCTSYRQLHASMMENVRKIHERIADVVIECLDCIEFISKYDKRGALMYLDPPYLWMERHSSRRYDLEMSMDDHEQMLRLVLNSESAFAISGYRSDLYDDMLSDWDLIEFSVKANSSMASKRRTEALWRSPACMEMMR